MSRNQDTGPLRIYSNYGTLPIFVIYAKNEIELIPANDGDSERQEFTILSRLVASDTMHTQMWYEYIPAVPDHHCSRCVPGK